MPTTLTYPALIPQPFAGTPAGPNYGGKNAIPVASASPLASFADGFPAVTMLPISGGGVPPQGKDFNGLFFYITSFQTWANAGGRFKYDSTLATAVGGYAAGCVLILNDNVSEVICVVSGTTNDPNSNMTGWAPFSGALSGAGFYQLDTGAADAYVIARSPAIGAYVNGMGIRFKAVHTNTGASTINAGPGAVPLRRSDGAAVVAGDIVNGTIYDAVYDLATTSFCLLGVVPSQVIAEVTPLLPVLFTAQNVVTGSRALGSNYTNTTGKPMHVAVTVVNGGAASNLTLTIGGIAQIAQGQASPGAVYSVSGMVPPGAVYNASISSGGTLTNWTETY